MNKKYQILWGGKDDTSIPQLGCFVAGTKVLIADGSTKNIEDIDVGDIVKSWNEITNKVEDSKVVKLKQPVHDDMLVIRFSNGVVNENTFDHPYYVKDKGWCSYSPTLTKERYDIDSELLEVGDICYFNKGGGLEEVEVSFIKENWGEVQTYIFELDNNYTFFANGILTHNKCFREDVKVLMGDESLKNIQDVEVGEKLVGKDGETNEVIKLHRPKLGDEDYRAPHNQRMVSINGSGFDVSEDHMIMTTDGWKAPDAESCNLIHKDVLKSEGIESIKDLQVGDKIVTSDGGVEEITSIEFKDDDIDLQLYNFNLTGNKTYHVVMEGHDKPMLVHNKEGSCFMSDQKISMFDGTYKKISVIKIGDIIKVYDENTNTVKSGQVNKIQTKLHDDAYELYLENGKILKPTGNHPFLEKNKGWVTIDGHNPNHAGGSGHLDIGNYVTDIKDGLVKVIDIVKIDGEHLTYNFIDMECGTIIADDIITHNSLELTTLVSGSSFEGSSSIQTHEDMSVGDTVLAASIAGVPDTDDASEFLLWEYTGSDPISSQITLVTASIESIVTSSHIDYKLIETPGKSEPLKITDNHPLLAKSESIWAFEYVGDIDTTYKLVSSSLEEVDITSINEVTGSPATGSFRRFDIEPQDTYFADGILIHN